MLATLLDSVTPLWRNYGKVIGVDAQDFLIIPWHRNEFAWGSERYPIKALPKRSVRHWVALILFFYTTKLADTVVAGCTLIFVALLPTVQRISWAVVDQRTSLRDYSLGFMGGGSGGDVYCLCTARRSVVVDRVVRQDS